MTYLYSDLQSWCVSGGELTLNDVPYDATKYTIVTFEECPGSISLQDEARRILEWASYPTLSDLVTYFNCEKLSSECCTLRVIHDLLQKHDLLKQEELANKRKSTAPFPPKKRACNPAHTFAVAAVKLQISDPLYVPEFSSHVDAKGKISFNISKKLSVYIALHTFPVEKFGSKAGLAVGFFSDQEISHEMKPNGVAHLQFHSDEFDEFCANCNLKFDDYLATHIPTLMVNGTLSSKFTAYALNASTTHLDIGEPSGSILGVCMTLKGVTVMYNRIFWNFIVQEIFINK